VFKKGVGDKVFILLLYVDDILVQEDKQEAERLRVHLKKRFGEVQFKVGERLSYLGMQIDIEDEGTTVDMSFYVKKLLEGTTVKGQTSPRNHSSFIVDKELQLLDINERKYFHSTTAKLLYLAKCARPDILTLVIFLCTRVQYVSEQDREKLERVPGYLKWMEEQVLVLKPCVSGEIVAYVDAAYTIQMT
jgi:hypothetical protein